MMTTIFLLLMMVVVLFLLLLVVARRRVVVTIITRYKRYAKQHTRDTLNTKCSQRLPQNVIELFAVFHPYIHPSSQQASQPTSQPQSFIHPQHCWLVVVAFFLYVSFSCFCCTLLLLPLPRLLLQYVEKYITTSQSSALTVSPFH